MYMAAYLSLMITLIVAEFQIGGSEIALFIWIFSLLKEEISQMINDTPCISLVFLVLFYINLSLATYILRLSNKVDLCMLTLYLLYIVFRVIAYLKFVTNINILIQKRQVYEETKLLTTATDLLNFGTLLAYMRLLHAFSFHPSLV